MFHLRSVDALRRRGLLLLATALLAGFSGCQPNQEIRTYSSSQTPALPEWANEDVTRIRMLAAIIPHENQVWFFKLIGLDSAVTEAAEPFAQFLRSVDFQGDAARPLRWKLPEGWQESGATGSRYATIRIPGTQEPVELTVTALGPESGNVRANVMRWRQQLGFQDREGRPIPLGPEELARYAFERQLPAGPATVVDLLSVALPKQGPGSRPAPPQEVEPQGGELPEVTYDVPPGWRKNEGRIPMAIAAFSAGPNDRAAVVTLSPLPGAAGGLLDNINRWRGQVGLDPVELKEVRDVARKLIIDGQPALYVQFAGPEQKSILGVVMFRQGVSWFVKLSGPSDVASAEAPAFIKFAESIRFQKHTEEGAGP